MLLYRAYAVAIFFPCHPYIWSTTVLHDIIYDSTLLRWEIGGIELISNYKVYSWALSVQTDSRFPAVVSTLAGKIIVMRIVQFRQTLGSRRLSVHWLGKL